MSNISRSSQICCSQFPLSLPEISLKPRGMSTYLPIHYWNYLISCLNKAVNMPKAYEVNWVRRITQRQGGPPRSETLYLKMGAVPKQILSKNNRRDSATLVMKPLISGKLWQVRSIGKQRIIILFHGFKLSIVSVRPRHHVCMGSWNVVRGDGCKNLPVTLRVVHSQMVATVLSKGRNACRRAGGFVFLRADRHAAALAQKAVSSLSPPLQILPCLELRSLFSWRI